MGPAFLDLQIITSTDLEKASAFFTSGSVGYLLGSLVAGIVYERVNKSVLLGASVAGMAAVTAVIPICSPYVLMIAMQFLCSCFKGALDTGKFVRYIFTMTYMDTLE
jgi:FHS family Na+ dependent glucose MFS transporter 1